MALIGAGRRVRRAGAVLGALAGSVCVIGSGGAAPANAAVPPLLWQAPSDGLAGWGTGQMVRPVGISVQPDTPGHLFVADTGNSRVKEFDAWGQLLRIWGWNVVASGPDDKPARNEKQELTVSAAEGAYEISYFDPYTGHNNETTGSIPFGAGPAAVQSALEGLESLAEGDVKVTGGPGDASGSSPYEIEFTGTLADTAVPVLRVASSSLAGGGGASVELLQYGGSPEVCVRDRPEPSERDECRKGQAGGFGPGGFWRQGPRGGVAVDGAGDVYVGENASGLFPGEEQSYRVQKFNSEGDFLLMWGGEVDKTTGADRCTAADVEAGDICGSGVPEMAPGSFEESVGIAIGSEGDVFVGDKTRIQKFDPQGHYVEDVALPGRLRAIDSAGDFYVSYPGEDDVHKLSPAGAELQSFKAESPGSVAVGPTNRVYVVEKPLLGLGAPRILGYEPDGACFICTEDEFRATPATNPAGLATSDSCGIAGEDLYASFGQGGSDGEAFLRAYGPHPDPTIEGCEPPKAPPGIEDSYASRVATDSATLGATINPHFWSGPLGATEYRLQYATAACIQAEGWGAPCVRQSAERTLEAEPVDAGIPTAPIAVAGLAPATPYRYRFLATGPGQEPDEGPVEGQERAFTTFALPPGPQKGCANEAMRSGPAALLPDCRAYEMVSPADKENGDIVALLDANQDPMALNQSSEDGDAFTFSSFRAFGDAQGSSISSQYLARRDPAAGWSDEAISPPLGAAFLSKIRAINNQFKAFTPDLCSAWLRQEAPVLAPGGTEGFAGLYGRSDCGADAGSYWALTTIAPLHRLPQAYVPELLGISADGSHAIFRVDESLPGSGAPPGDPGPEVFALYEAYGDGQVRFLCVRPDSTKVSEGCSAGTGTHVISFGRQEPVSNAISADGSRVFWSDAPDAPGNLYVRIEGKKTQQLSSSPAQYWTAAKDGSAAVFTTGETPPETHRQALAKGEADLHRYDLDAEEDEVIAEGVYGALGASEDASRIYFASGEVLDEGAQKEEPNLYLYQRAGKGEEPTYDFIATLGEGDVGVAEHKPSPVQIEPDRHTAQVTPDGLAATFMSRAPLTGQDNADAASGQPDMEVFHYDARTGALDCASCTPTGARPQGREYLEGVWAASRIPGAQTEAYQVPRVLSSDGGRLFFESYQPLVADDTNGKADVYEWERPGEGSCTGAAAPRYSPAAGGCVSLISSGQSPSDATIADVSPSGDDVFFATASPLLPKSDPDQLYDIYDARAGGGFPPPAAPPAPCEGEACQSPPPAPTPPAPASSAFHGPGNPRAGRCAKAARRAKRLAHRSRRLRRVARRKGPGRAARRLRRRSRRFAHRARGFSKGAKRCRRRARRNPGMAK